MATCNGVGYGSIGSDGAHFSLVLACVPDGFLTGPDFGCIAHEPDVETMRDDDGA